MTKGVTIDFEGLSENEVTSIMRSLRKIKKLPEPVRWTGEVKKIKRLPRDEKGNIKNTFVANGVHYNIIFDSIGIRRWTEYEKMLVSLQYGRTFQQISDIITEGIKIAQASTDLAECKVEVSKHFLSFQDAFADFAREDRYSLAFQTATLFIVRDGTDMSKYDKDIAEQDIENWTVEGLSEEDFFILSITGDKTFVKELELRNKSLALKASLLENVSRESL